MPAHHPRRKKFIDPQLQGRHWLLLIAIELLIVGLVLLYTYQGMQQILEQSLYSIHTSYRQALISGFFLMMGKVALMTLLINLLLLAIGHQLWTLRVRSLQQQLKSQLNSLAQLNFCASENLSGMTGAHHELSVLLSHWSQRERSRFSALTALIAGIPDPLQLSHKQNQELQDRLEKALDEFLLFNPHGHKLKQPY